MSTDYYLRDGTKICVQNISKLEWSYQKDSVGLFITLNTGTQEHEYLYHYKSFNDVHNEMDNLRMCMYLVKQLEDIKSVKS